MFGENILQKTSRAMSSNFDVTLISAGDQAFTDGRIICVPALPENLNKSDWEVVCGYTEHEVAHIRHTQFDIFKGIIDPLVKNLTNLIEDIRIEKKHGSEYYGAKILLGKTISSIWNKHFAENEDCVNIGTMLMFEGRRQCANIEMDSLIPRFDKECKEAFGDDIFDKINRLENTKDSYTLALFLLDKLKEQAEKEEKQKEDEKGGDQGDDGNEENKDSKDSLKDDKDKKNDGLDSGENEGVDDGEKSDDDPESEGSGKSDDDSDGQNDEGDEDTDKDDVGGSGDCYENPDDEDAGDDGDDGEWHDGIGETPTSNVGKSEADVSPDDGDGPDESKIKKVEAAMASGKPGSDDDEPSSKIIAKNILQDLNGTKDFAEMVAGELHEMNREAVSSGQYLVFDKSYDKIIPMSPGDTEYKVDRNLTTFHSMRREIEKIGSFKSKVSSMFLARVLSKWQGDKEGGKINPRALNKLKCGYKNIFREKTKNDELDTAISFLVDFSGSMSGSSIREALRTVILFLESLGESKIKSEVLGYTTDDWPDDLRDRYNRLDGSITRLYGRTDPLLTYVIKDFNEPYNRKVKARIGAYGVARLAENCDGDSVMIAYNRLMMRKEKRKILFVLSDGAVANMGNTTLGKKYLKHVCKSIEQSGNVELVGIGLYDNSVKNYYKNNIIVSGRSSLVETMSIELKKIFKV